MTVHIGDLETQIDVEPAPGGAAPNPGPPAPGGDEGDTREQQRKMNRDRQRTLAEGYGD